jgi:hypothetical protein
MALSFVCFSFPLSFISFPVCCVLLIHCTAKEVFMLKANQFITNNLDKVRGFFEAVASLPPTHPHPPTITTVEDVTAHDLRIVHAVLVKNLSRIIKSLAQYKHKDIVPRLWEILTDLGDPSNAYTNPSSPASNPSTSTYSTSSTPPQ